MLLASFGCDSTGPTENGTSRVPLIYLFFGPGGPPPIPVQITTLPNTVRLRHTLFLPGSPFDTFAWLTRRGDSLMFEVRAEEAVRGGVAIGWRIDYEVDATGIEDGSYRVVWRNVVKLRDGRTFTTSIADTIIVIPEPPGLSWAALRNPIPIGFGPSGDPTGEDLSFSRSLLCAGDPEPEGRIRCRRLSSIDSC